MPQPTNTNNDHVDEETTKELPSFPIALLVLIFSPLTIVSAFATYFLFAKARIRLSVIFWFGLFPYLLAFVFFWQFALEQFIASFTVTIPQAVATESPIFPAILTAMLQQALLSVPLGVIAGLGYSIFRWRTRPVWVETKFRLTPWEILRKKKVTKEISLDKNTPKEGMTLGIDETGHRVIQTYAESVAHTLVFGASGAGKTRTLSARIRDAMKNGQGIILVDLKGDDKFAEEVGKLAERYDRSFYHWLMHSREKEYTGPSLNGPASYDPIGRGEATRRKDLIIESRKWSEEHYKIQTSFYVQMVMSVIVANPNTKISTLTDVMRLLDPSALKERSIPLSGNPIYNDLIQDIDRLNDETLSHEQKQIINSMAAQLGVLLNSVAGPWLKKEPTDTNNIDLFRAAHRGEVVVFSLDSSNYPDQAKLLANLIIQDLKTLSSELRSNPAPNPVSVVIDEFSAVGSDNILGLVNKSRDAKMPVTLATQTLADLSQESPTLREQLIGTVNSYIIHRTNIYSDAEELASLSGKVIRKRFNESVIYKTGLLSRGGAVGKGTIEDVEEYAILPKEIQKLAAGEFYYINKNPMRIVKGRGILEDTDAVGVNSDKPKINFIKREVPVVVVEPTVEPIPDVLTFSSYQEASHNPITPVTDSSEQFEASNQRADLNRLKNILNQDPNDLLKRKPTQPTEQEILPVVNVEPAMPTLPSFPKFPQPVKKPVTVPSSPSVVAPPMKTPSLPSRPATPPPAFPTRPAMDSTKPVSPFPSRPGAKPEPVTPPARREQKDPKTIKDDFDF